VSVTWKAEHAARTFVRHDTCEREPTDDNVRFMQCSDLLEDFHKRISQMESEYLRAMMGLYDSVDVIPDLPRKRALDGTS